MNNKNKIIPKSIIDDYFEDARRRADEELIESGRCQCESCGVWFEYMDEEECPACGYALDV